MTSFADALLAARTPVVMEVKRRGAEGEDLLGDRSVSDVVEDYERLGAPCLSVVTGRSFGGDDDLLREVAAVSSLPLLKKDFVMRERQILEARALGASAVLLTAEVLPAALLGRLVVACLRHGLTPFVEVSRAGHVDALVHAEDAVVAVNNKDIRRHERGAADIDRSLALLPEVRRVGAGCTVSASGIDQPAVAARLLDAGFDALLVATGLLRSGDPRGWLDAVARSRVRAPERHLTGSRARRYKPEAH